MIYFILALLLFALIIICNVIVFHLAIRQAIKKFVNPALSSKDLVFVNYKWPGFFSRGNFKEGEKALNALFSTGLNRTSIYSYIYYKDLKVGLIKSVTIKIYRTGSSIEDVVYSSAVN
ncbi:MAG: hypothetical protein JST50_19000 [Bacteroidetes bacterium]|nr:hypothetical protein [Bacteroidota bacterium]